MSATNNPAAGYTNYILDSLQGVSFTQQDALKIHLAVQERTQPLQDEPVYKKIIKHLIVVHLVGTKGSKKVFAVYGGKDTRFITNVEAFTSEEAKDLAVDELVKMVNYT